MEVFLLVVCWYNIIEQLENVSYSKKELQGTEKEQTEGSVRVLTQKSTHT